MQALTNFIGKRAVRAAMTEDVLNFEKESGYFGALLIKKLHNVEYLENHAKVSMKCRSLNEYNDLNLKDGIMAQYVSMTILTESDRQATREQNQKLKKEGNTIRDILSKINKKLTAGKLTLDVRQYGLTSNVRDHVKLKSDEELAKKRRYELNYMKLCYKADKVLAKRGADSDLLKWNSKSDISTFLSH